MTDDRPNDPSSPQGASPADSQSRSPQSESSPYDQTSPWSSPPPAAPTYGSAPSFEKAPPPQPYGQQQPYSQQHPYAQQPYGPGQQQPYQQGYGQPGAPYAGAQPAGYGGYAPPPVAKARSSATLWLIVNIVSVLFCANLLGIVGAIYAGLALGQVDTQMDEAQKKTRLAKIWFFVGLALGALLIVAAIIGVLAISNDDTSSNFIRPADI